MDNGLYQSIEQVLGVPRRPESTETKLGDIVYQDINGDGKINSEDNATFPRISMVAGVNGENNRIESTFYLRNAAFLRLKNLSLTYDFKHKLLKSAKWLSTCQVSLTGSNLFTISGVSDYWDPETTNTNGGYPTSRIYSLGVTLGF